ncbi:MAG: (2Fe-2S)-binding protein [Gammaproteobacteria bacterium]|nr:(2Fe-2S)-binding protein [Gammaproteobacteria bacterium]
MFRSINSNQAELITIYFEGKPLNVPKDHNVATALLEAGIRSFRKTTLNNESRGPYCMMGVCFDCLTNINGLDNQQSCAIQVSEGMKIKRQVVNTSGKDE